MIIIIAYTQCHPSPLQLTYMYVESKNYNSCSFFRIIIISIVHNTCRCDQLTGDSSGEAESWANAARQFLLAEDQLFQARNASYQEMIEASIQCFLLAVHVSCTCT